MYAKLHCLRVFEIMILMRGHMCYVYEYVRVNVVFFVLGAYIVLQTNLFSDFLLVCTGGL